MASEKMSESEMAKLTELLAKAQRSGCAPEVLLQGPMPSGKVERSQGSMSDSSKAAWLLRMKLGTRHL